MPAYAGIHFQTSSSQNGFRITPGYRLVLILMIETLEGLMNADEIAKVTSPRMIVLLCSAMRLRNSWYTCGYE
jgi:citrate lyase beta subunit